MKTRSIFLITVMGLVFISVAQSSGNHENFPNSMTIQPDNGTDSEQLLQRVRERGSVRVWIYYKMEGYQREGLLETESQGREQRSDIENMHNHLMNELAARGLNVSGVNKLRLRPAVVMSVDEETLKYLLEAPFVQKIRPVRMLRAHTDESTSIIKADVVYNSIGVPYSDQTVVIIDTGVDMYHEALENTVVDDGACFSTDDPWEGLSTTCHNNFTTDDGPGAGQPCTLEWWEEGYLDCDHGTHVAGIAAGYGSGFKGTAPHARIFPILTATKIDDCDGEGNPCHTYFDDDIVSALDYIYSDLRHEYEIASINISLGDSTDYSSPCDNVFPNVADAVNDLFDEGIATVASAGNANFSDGLEYPACLSNVVSVGATDSQDQRWSSGSEGSNASSMLDLVAPGVGIESTIPGNAYEQRTGTSMAAPHVAGTLAIMAGGYPELLEISWLIDLLKDYTDWDSDHMGEPWPPSDEYGHGRLNTREAVIEALHSSGKNLVIDYNQTINNETYQSTDVYVVNDVTLTIEGTTTFEESSDGIYPSRFFVGGTLQGPSSATLNIINGELNVLPTGRNNFDGTINFDPLPDPLPDPHEFTSSTTIGSGDYESGVIIHPNITITIQSGATVVMSDDIEMQEAFWSNTTVLGDCG